MRLCHYWSLHRFCAATCFLISDVPIAAGHDNHVNKKGSTRVYDGRADVQSEATAFEVVLLLAPASLLCRNIISQCQMSRSMLVAKTTQQKGSTQVYDGRADVHSEATAFEVVLLLAPASLLCRNITHKSGPSMLVA